MTEGQKAPESLMELIRGDQNDYQLRFGYSLELVHGLMGYFPAIYRATNNIVVTFERDLMQEIWKKLSPRRSRMNESLFMVNFETGTCFPISSTETYWLENSKPIVFLTKEKYEELTSSIPEVFQWAPGLVGNDMNVEEFRETLEAARA